MSISVKTRKMLWGRSASRCNFPGCGCELVMDATETDDESIVGEECHIVAQASGGARGDGSTLTAAQRDKYNNLILLCNTHHKLVDDQRNYYTVDMLKDMKNNFEKWVSENLSIDYIKLRNDEIYSAYIDEWSELCGLDNWQAWSSFVLGSGQPRIYKKTYEKLVSLNEWLLSRIWPGHYPELETAFKNFRYVLGDFISVFSEHMEDHYDMWSTEKIYHINEWNEKLYNKLLDKYNRHVDLVQDLMLELTRACNYVCENIRKYILYSYRLNEGAALITYGPLMDMTFRVVRVEYEENEKTDSPYPGLEQFREVVKTRDIHFTS